MMTVALVVSTLLISSNWFGFIMEQKSLGQVIGYWKVILAFIPSVFNYIAAFVVYSYYCLSVKSEYEAENAKELD